jgi:hypothetical protein
MSTGSALVSPCAYTTIGHWPLMEHGKRFVMPGNGKMK